MRISFFDHNMLESHDTLAPILNYVERKREFPQGME